MRTLLSGLLASLLLSCPLAGESAQNVQGVLSDPSGSALPGAVVALLSRAGSSRRVTTADGVGRFSFSQVPPGDYWLEASADGFNQTASAVTVRDREVDVEIRLEVSQVRTEVVVTATGLARPAAEVARAVDVLHSDQIGPRVEISLGEALQTMPGLRVQQVGGPGALTRILSRGLRAQDTAVTMDGLRFRDAATTQGDATPFLENLFLVGTERVEVMRGTGSSLYGSHALGGVVNLVSDTGGGQTRGRVNFDGGGLGWLRGQAKLAGGLWRDRITYSGGVQHLNVRHGVDGDDPFRNTTTQAAVTAYPFGARLGGRLWWGDSFAMLNDTPYAAPASLLPPRGAIRAIPVPLATQRLIESGQPFSWAGANLVPNLNDPDNRRASRFRSAALTFEKQLTPRLLIGSSYQNVSTRRIFEDGPAGVRFEPNFRTLTRITGGVDTWAARAAWNPVSWASTAGGYEWERETYDSPYQDFHPDPSRRETYRSSARQRSHAAFAHQELHGFGDRLLLSFSGRVQDFRLRRPRFEGGTLRYDQAEAISPPRAWTGDTAVAYRITRTGTKVRAHAGSGYRAPSIYERFGATFFDGAFSALGDPRLRPERSRAFDWGVDQYLARQRVRLSATHFYTDLRETIFFDSTGILNPATDPFGRSSGYRNAGGGIARGVEASAELAPGFGARVQAAYTYTDSTVRVSQVRDNDFFRATLQSRHQGTIVWLQRFGKRWDASFDVWLASAHAQIFSRRAFLFPGARKADAAVHYTHPFSDRTRWRIYAKCTNVFASEYLENGFRTPGRWAIAGMGWEF
jgi:iron complex outermembrane receptor protein